MTRSLHIAHISEILLIKNVWLRNTSSVGIREIQRLYLEIFFFFLRKEQGVRCWFANKITPHLRYWCVRHIFRQRREKKSRLLRKATRSWWGCNLLVLGVPTTSLLYSCPVFMTARGRQYAWETRAAQRAERTRAGQNAEWSGSTSRGENSPQALCIPGHAHCCSFNRKHVRGFMRSGVEGNVE